jgi:hypothetical protein
VFPRDLPIDPPQQIAGQFGLEVRVLLAPVLQSPVPQGVRLLHVRDLAQPLDLAAIFASGEPSPLSRALLRDQALIIHAAGRFWSTDRAILVEVQSRYDHCSLDLEITHVESQDGEPAPRDLYLLLRLDFGDLPVLKLAVQLTERRRDFHGHEAPLDGSATSPVIIEFSE